MYGDPLPEGAIARLGIPKERHTYTSATFSEDSKALIIVSAYASADVVDRRDVVTGKEVKVRELEVWRISWSAGDEGLSPNGKLVALRSNDCVIVYDAATGKQRHRLPGNAEGFVFAPNSALLATFSSGEDQVKRVRIWDPATGKSICSLPDRPAAEWSGSSFSQDGKYFATADYDASVQIWDAKTGEKVRGRECKNHLIAFATDGKTPLRACGWPVFSLTSLLRPLRIIRATIPPRPFYRAL